MEFRPIGSAAFEGTGKSEKAKAALADLKKHSPRELKKVRLLCLACVPRAVGATGRWPRFVAAVA